MTTVKSLLKNPGPIIGLYLVGPGPSVIEYAHQAGFDFVRIDLEHALYSYSELRELVRTATLLDMPCQVRVCDLSDITKLLDMGVTGIVVPDADNLERAREAVRLTKVHPLGRRGMFPIGRCIPAAGCASFGDYVAAANDLVDLTLQVEDVAAAEILDQLAALEGVDMLASGKADISQSLGIPGQTADPQVLDFEKLILKKALEHGKQAALMVGSKQAMDSLRPLGCKVFTVGPDEVLLANAFKTFIREYKA